MTNKLCFYDPEHNGILREDANIYRIRSVHREYVVIESLETDFYYNVYIEQLHSDYGEINKEVYDITME